MIGIRPEAYRRYERGEAAPQIDTLESMRRVLRVSADWPPHGDEGTKGAPNPPKDQVLLQATLSCVMICGVV